MTDTDTTEPTAAEDPCPDGCDPATITAIDAFDDQCTRCLRIGPNLAP